MSRYRGIRNAQFGATALTMPVRFRLWRQGQSSPAASGDEYPRNVQLTRPAAGVELIVRDTPAAEGLALGAVGSLSVTLCACSAGQPDRVVTLSRAVLTGIEIDYAQGTPAQAKLTFLAEWDGAGSGPIEAREVTP